MADRYPAELNTVARVKIGVGGVVTSARRWLDLVAGTGVTLTPVDDGVNEKVSVTVTVTGAPPTGNAGGDLTGTYPNPTIGAGKVVTASILDANVTTAKIADANVTSAKMASEAWTAWTPTVSSITGTITTASATGKWYRVGRLITWHAVLVITTNGTGATGVTFTLPVNSVGTADSLGSGRNMTSTGKGLTVTNVGSASLAQVLNYDNSYPAVSGDSLAINGFYEAAT